MLVGWIQHREGGRLTLDQMLTILGIAMAGSKAGDVRPSNVVPLMVFLSGLGGWGGTEAAPEKIGNRPRAPNSVEHETRLADKASGDRAQEERRAAGEQRQPSAEPRAGPRGGGSDTGGLNLEGQNAGGQDTGGLPGSPRAPAASMLTGSAPVEDRSSRLEQDAGTRELPPVNAERINRIRQQLDELAAQSNSSSGQASSSSVQASSSSVQASSSSVQTSSSRDAEPPRYREIETASSQPSSSQWSFVGPATASPQAAQEDIFRAFRTDVPDAAAKDEATLRASVLSGVAKIAGVRTLGKRQLRGMVGVFGFLILLPPAVVCLLLYRDSVRMASDSSAERFVTRMRGDELSETDPTRQRRVKGRARAGGQSRAGNKVGSAAARPNDEETVPLSGLSVLLDTGQSPTAHDQVAEIPVEKGPAKIPSAKPEMPPTMAGTESGMLAEMPGSKGSVESWMSILGHTDQIQTSLREPGSILETAPPKIHNAAKPERPPTIAESKMPGGIPKAAVEISYPVLGVPAVTEAATSAKMPSSSGAGRTESGSIPGIGASGKSFDLLGPSVAVSSGMLSNNIVKFQMPSYPKAARKQKVEGDVLVRVLISEKGKIEKAVALNGPSPLRGAVEKAVRRWRYKPYLQDGKPVKVQTWVSFHFAMKES
jgi:TonB family protein